MAIMDPQQRAEQEREERLAYEDEMTYGDTDRDPDYDEYMRERERHFVDADPWEHEADEYFLWRRFGRDERAQAERDRVGGPGEWC